MSMRTLASLLIVLLESPVGFAADVIPPAPLPEKGSGPPPATAPENPSQSGAPAIPPSKLDPGIERRPLAVPDPRSAVPPPNVDPEMSVNPETAPPAKDAIKPRQGEEPHDKPPSR
jgi:hypothetical protein